MKHLLTICLVCLLCVLGAGEASAQISTRITSGSTLPTTCSVGGLYEKTGSSAGLYACLSTNTWTGPFLVSPVTFGQGGTGLTSASDDTAMVSNGSAWQAKAIADCDDTGGNHLNYDTATNTFSCGTSGTGSGGALSSITAASTTNTIDSANNHSQIWNWALTSNSVSAFTFGETTAATNGSGTNQNIVKINTLSTSTAAALSIDNFGATYGLRIFDVASDTSFFSVDQDGEVGIQCNGSPTHSLQLCDPNAHIDMTGSSSALTLPNIRILNVSAEVGTIGSVDLLLTTNTGSTRGTFKQGTNRLEIANNGNTSITTTNQHSLAINSDGVNEYFTIGFGYLGIAAYIGYQEISNSSLTYGDLVFGTKASTGAVAPTEQLRIKQTDGAIVMTNLKTTGAASGKKMVCVDTSTGQLYSSTSDTSCAN